MRKILFRAWCPHQEGYINGFNMIGFSTGQGGPKRKLQRYGNEWNIEDVILEQWTGLLDKNGKMVFEGDMVQNQYKAKRQVSRTMYGEYRLFCGASHSHFVKGWEKGIEWEVISTIHDKEGES